MKTTAIASFLLTGLVMASAGSLTAQEIQHAPPAKTFGVGLIVGEPTGASLKYWLSDVAAIDGVVGISLDDGNDFAAHADYLLLSRKHAFGWNLSPRANSPSGEGTPFEGFRTLAD